MEAIQTDILIVGAGPGGAMCALTLAKAGIPCHIVDRAVFPRDKVCGDALSGKVVEVMKKTDPALLEELAVSPIQVGSWGVTFVAPNRQKLRVPFTTKPDEMRHAPGFISRRFDFDNFLVNTLKRYPQITLHEGVNLRHYERSEQSIIAIDEYGVKRFDARLVVAADGAQSPFARLFTGRHPDYKHYCAGVRAYFKGVKGLDPENFIELHFLENFLPGYFWIFPLPGGYANVGVGMRSDTIREKGVNLRERMMWLIENDEEMRWRFKDATMHGKIEGFSLPLGSRKRRISGDNFLLVGDAASLIDPFTGEGIGNAMLSGRMAAQVAEAALRANDFSRLFLRQYDGMVYGRLWSELKLSRRLQQLVEYPWLFNLVVKKANANRALQEMISCMFEDLSLREQLKKPSFYLKLLFN